MALTRDFKQTVAERLQSEPLFAREMFNEALTLLLAGEAEVARLMLRELINSTIGFEELGRSTAKPAKSLHRMFSAQGNPNMDNLAAVVRALGSELHLSPTVVSEPLPGAYSAVADRKQIIKQKLRAKHSYNKVLLDVEGKAATKRHTRSAA